MITQCMKASHRVLLRLRSIRATIYDLKTKLSARDPATSSCQAEACPPQTDAELDYLPTANCYSGDRVNQSMRFMVAAQSAVADWATLKVQNETSAMTFYNAQAPNIIGGCLITEIGKGRMKTNTPVTIGLPVETPKATLHSCTVLFRYGEQLYNVQMATVERPLGRGCSGAWACYGNEWCGTVVAISQTLPWAYVIPASTIVEDIETVCVRSVTLPLGQGVLSLDILVLPGPRTLTLSGATFKSSYGTDPERPSLTFSEENLELCDGFDSNDGPLPDRLFPSEPTFRAWAPPLPHSQVLSTPETFPFSSKSTSPPSAFPSGSWASIDEDNPALIYSTSSFADQGYESDEPQSGLQSPPHEDRCSWSAASQVLPPKVNSTLSAASASSSTAVTPKPRVSSDTTSDLVSKAGPVRIK